MQHKTGRQVSGPPAALGALQLVHRQRIEELVGDVHRGRPLCRNLLQAAVPPHLQTEKKKV